MDRRTRRQHRRYNRIFYTLMTFALMGAGLAATLVLQLIMVLLGVK